MILVFFVSPLLLAVSTFFKIYYADEIILFSSEYFNDIYFGFQLLSLFQYVVFTVMLIVYPLYPAAFSIEKFFLNREPQNSAIIEYEILRNMVYVLSPFFVFAILYSVAARMEEYPLTAIIKIGESMPSYYIVIYIGVIFFIVASALLKLIVLTIRKDFRFYFARTIFKTVPRKNEVEKVRLLVKALDSYNRYLRRSLGLQINDIKKVYSKILSDTSLDKENIINELSITFDDLNDKFKPIRCLSDTLQISDTEHFLARESTGKKIGDWASITATIVSTIAAVIGVLSTLGVLGLT
jgi:hypothetical protein